MVRLEPESETSCRLVAYRSGDSELTDEELGQVAGGLDMPRFEPLASSRPFKLSTDFTAQALIAYLALGV